MRAYGNLGGNHVTVMVVSVISTAVRFKGGLGSEIGRRKSLHWVNEKKNAIQTNEWDSEIWDINHCTVFLTIDSALILSLLFNSDEAYISWTFFPLPNELIAIISIKYSSRAPWKNYKIVHYWKRIMFRIKKRTNCAEYKEATAFLINQQT